MGYSDDDVIAPETIDRIRETANLADVIGQAVKLERRGRNLIGLCPFHKEKSPSFNVNEERGFYHCFGCKASGDVFRFVQETEGLTFIEAVKSLGERFGIDVEDDLSAEERRRRHAERRRELGLYETNEAAARFFERCLERAPHRDLALAELAARGLPWTVDGAPGPARPVLQAFRIGYAPAEWDALATHLKKKGHDLRAAEMVGLLAPRRNGPGYYDRFRHRLMFAVIDLHGRIVAFSGRALPPLPDQEESPAKYINSPESPIYKKRGTVFGLYQARSSLRGGRPAVIVEGNFDVMSLHAAGVTEAVAPLGTAFTTEQAKQVRRFTSHVTFLFDGDAAGQKATIASREPCAEAGLSARVARLPEGADPDDFVRKQGPEQLSHLLASAPGMLDYLIAQALDESFVAEDAVGRAQKIRQVADLLASEDDANVRALAEQHADKLAGRLGVADAHTFRALRDTIKSSLRSARVHAPRFAADDDAGSSQPELSLHDRVTRALLGTLLDFPELSREPELRPYLAHLSGDAALAFAALARHVEKQGVSPTSGALVGGTALLQRVPTGLRSFFERRMAAPKHTEVDVARVELFANFDKLRKMELTKQSTGAYGEMERARQEGDFEQELELLREQEERARARRGL